MSKRNICVVITARPSYSRIKTTLKAIQNHPKLELQLVVAGSALLDRYGNAISYIEEDGFVINERVFMVLEGENKTSMAKTTGLGVMEFSNTFYNLKPDAVVAIADRFETIAISIAASYQNIPLIHIQGGEVTGNIDEKVRHANTKLADIHFVSSEEAKTRVLKLGEDENYVFNTGCPSIDIAFQVSKNSKLNFDPIKKYGGVGEKINWEKGYIVVMQHPVTTEYKQSRENVLKTLKVVHKLGLPAFWFWPNVDSGADETSKGIRSYREEYQPDNIHFFKNMKPEDFLRLLCNSKCLVGNSSVGIRECAFLGVPVVNIGTRQYGRLRSDNVIDVTYEEEAIKNGILNRLQTQNEIAQSSIYGTGDSGEKMAEIMANIELRYHKTITY